MFIIIQFWITVEVVDLWFPELLELDQAPLVDSLLLILALVKSSLSDKSEPVELSLLPDSWMEIK